MMTCGYTSEQSWSQLLLSFLPSFFLLYWVYLLRLASVRSVSPLQHCATALLAFKSALDITQTCFCYEIVLFSLPKAFNSLLSSLELTSILVFQALIAKGYCLHRKSLCPRETLHILLLFPLFSVGFFVYRLDPDSLYLVLLLDLGVFFCVTMHFYTNSLFTLNSVLGSVFGLMLEGRIQAEIRLMHKFQLYLYLYYSVLTLKWVCLPVAYRPISPELDIYVWLGVGLYLFEVWAVLGTVRLVCPRNRLQVLDIVCTEDTEIDLATPLYVPSLPTPPPSTPVLVVVSQGCYSLGLPEAF